MEKIISNSSSSEKNSIKFGKKSKQQISNEDFEIITTLHSLKKELDFLHNHLDFVTEPILIDSLIYEKMATNMKYTYYLNLCKEKGLVASGY